MNSPVLRDQKLQVRTSSRAERLDGILVRGILVVLLFGPLAFGAVEPWATFLLEIASAMLLGIWVARQLAAGEVRLQSHPLFLPMGAFAILIAVQLTFGLSAYRYQTFSGAMVYLAYAIICFLLVQCLRRNSEVKAVSVVLSAFGTALALFALVQGLGANTHLYWLRAPAQGGWIYGPYTNHNHYAGLMEMLIPIPLVLSQTRYGDTRIRGIALGMAALMATTIFTSGSRGGMLAFAVQIALFAGFLVKRRRGLRTACVLGGFLLAVCCLIAWIGGGVVVDRMASIHTEAQREISGGTRWSIDRDGSRMFLTRPILGYGLGAFPEVYPQFRSFYTTFYVNRAHNDYLQLLTEMGSLGFAVMLWWIVMVYRCAARKLEDWPTDLNGAVSLAALLGVTGILVHSFLDSNLQIPANALFFYTLCILAAMDSRFTVPRRVPRAARAAAVDSVWNR
jgi:O-antigen ligase